MSLDWNPVGLGSVAGGTRSTLGRLFSMRPSEYTLKNRNSRTTSIDDCEVLQVFVTEAECAIVIKRGSYGMKSD